MDKIINGKGNKQVSNNQSNKVISFQELSDEIKANPELSHIQPTPEPKDFEEIEY